MIDFFVFFFQAEDGIRDLTVTGVQTCALPIFPNRGLGLHDARGHLLLEIAHRVHHREQRVPGPEIRTQIDECRKVEDRKSTRLNSSHSQISYAVFCLKKKKKNKKKMKNEKKIQ